MAELTRIQGSILQFIADVQQHEERSPTGTEIQQHFGYNHHSTARQHLHALERKGFIELARGGHGVPYHIRLLGPAYSRVDTLRLPLVGSIAAGKPEEALMRTDEWIERIDQVLDVHSGDFLLEVKGESMIGDGIHPGDIVLIHPQATVQRGQIAAVMVRDEDATLKRVYAEPPSDIRLVPSHPSMEDMVYPAHEVRVVGLYTGLMRPTAHRMRQGGV
jgi:repressor LexA